MKQENHDCYLLIHALCQEGVTLVESREVDLDRSQSVSQVLLKSL